MYQTRCIHIAYVMHFADMMFGMPVPTFSRFLNAYHISLAITSSTACSLLLWLTWSAASQWVFLCTVCLGVL